MPQQDDAPAKSGEMRRLLAISLLAIAVAGCGESSTYSTEEVVDAFERHGYRLVGRDFSGDTAAAREGRLLTPRGGQPFIVIVSSNAAADEAWDDYEAQQTSDSFDARRANVVVISDSGLGPRHRQGVLAALSSLPDRGADVMTAGPD